MQLLSAGPFAENVVSVKPEVGFLSYVGKCRAGDK